MKELSTAINNEIASDGSHDCGTALHAAAKAWALFALDTYTDAFLTKALAISKAIAEFTSVLKKDEPQE